MMSLYGIKIDSFIVDSEEKGYLRKSVKFKMHTGDSLRIIEILNLRVKKLRRRRNFCALWRLISEDAYRG